MPYRTNILELCQSQRPDEALRLAQQWVIEDPNNVQALSIVALAQEGLGQFKDAMATLEQAIGLSSNNPVLLMHRGQMAFAKNQFVDAEKDLTAASHLAVQAQHPYQFAATLGQAVVLAKLGKTEDARACVSRCPDDTRMWMGGPVDAATFKKELKQAVG